MPDGHNDYLILTREYLKGYKRLTEMRRGWIAEIGDTERELASVPVAVSKYGDEPGGGSGESSPTERLAARRMALRERYGMREKDVAEIARLEALLRQAFAALGEEDARILKSHYINGATWYDIGDELGYSYQGIRKKGSRALHNLAQYIFGLKAARPQQIVLVV
jgi:hypothetical protein